jgi:hypothetical protein
VLACDYVFEGREGGDGNFLVGGCFYVHFILRPLRGVGIRDICLIREVKF